MSIPKCERTPFIRRFQIYPKTIPPIKFGIKKIERKIATPLSSLVRRTARLNAKTFTVTIETTVNNEVNPKA